MLKEVRLLCVVQLKFEPWTTVVAPYNFSSSYNPAIGMHLLCVYTTLGSASERGGGWVHLKGENLGCHRVSHFSPFLHEWTEKTVLLPCRATILAMKIFLSLGGWSSAESCDC